MNFHQRLIHELTAMDVRDARRKGYNPYALGIYFRAANDVTAEMADGTSAETAFRTNFTPTRGLHRVARNLGLRLDIERGRWVDTRDSVTA